MLSLHSLRKQTRGGCPRVNFVLSNSRKSHQALCLFSRWAVQGAVTRLLPRRNYPCVLQTTDSLEISPTGQVLHSYQVCLSSSCMHMIKHLGYLLFLFPSASWHDVISAMGRHDVGRRIKRLSLFSLCHDKGLRNDSTELRQ